MHTNHRPTFPLFTALNKLAWARRALLLVAAIAIACAWSASAQTLTNAVVANVSPASFSVLWQAAPGSSPGLNLFADPDGQTNLAGQFGLEILPVHTGSPLAANDYEIRQSQNVLKQKMQDYGIQLVRVSGLKPQTSYYFQMVSRAASGLTTEIPESGPFPEVRTPPETAFVPDAFQVIIDVPGSDMHGRVLTLTHSNMLSTLASVVGDGAGTNQVVFNLANLFAAAGNTNFTTTGSLEFMARTWGQGPGSGLTEEFLLSFTNAFSVARSLAVSMQNEFASLWFESTMVLTGDFGSVPLMFDSTVSAGDLTLTLDIPPGYLTNLSLVPVASEVDPANVTIVPLTSSRWRIFVAARPGQGLFGAREVVRLNFRAIPNARSGFVSIKPVLATVRNLTQSPVANVFTRQSRVVVLGAEPLIEAKLAVSGRRSAVLYGHPWSSYAIERAPALRGASWIVEKRIPMTEFVVEIGDLVETSAITFYRALEFQANPPVLEFGFDSNRQPQLLVFGQENTSYQLQYTTNISPTAVWLPVMPIGLTNSFRYFSNLPITGSPVFFRLAKP